MLCRQNESHIVKHKIVRWCLSTFHFIRIHAVSKMYVRKERGERRQPSFTDGETFRRPSMSELRKGYI